MSDTSPRPRGSFASPRVPSLLKAIAFFGLPFLLLSGIAVAIWLVWRFMNGVQATVFVLGELPLIAGIIAFACGKIDLKTLLCGLLVFGLIVNLQLILGGLMWLARGY